MRYSVPLFLVAVLTVAPTLAQPTGVRELALGRMTVLPEGDRNEFTVYDASRFALAEDFGSSLEYADLPWIGPNVAAPVSNPAGMTEDEPTDRIVGSWGMRQTQWDKSVPINRVDTLQGYHLNAWRFIGEERKSQLFAQADLIGSNLSINRQSLREARVGGAHALGEKTVIGAEGAVGKSDLGGEERWQAALGVTHRSDEEWTLGLALHHLEGDSVSEEWKDFMVNAAAVYRANAKPMKLAMQLGGAQRRFESRDGTRGMRQRMIWFKTRLVHEIPLGSGRFLTGWRVSLSRQFYDRSPDVRSYASMAGGLGWADERTRFLTEVRFFHTQNDSNSLTFKSKRRSVSMGMGVERLFRMGGSLEWAPALGVRYEQISSQISDDRNNAFLTTLTGGMGIESDGGWGLDLTLGVGESNQSRRTLLASLGVSQSW